MKFPATAIMVLAGSLALPLAEEAPEWLSHSLKRPVPETAAKTPRVVIHKQGTIDVTRSETRRHTREAVKILTVEGQRSFALLAPKSINQDFKLIGGWKVRPDGDVKRYDTKALIEVDADSSYEFSMNKLKMFRPDEARVGDVIAWEYTTSAKSEAHQVSWSFGWSSPTLLSRLAVKVPPGGRSPR